MKYEEIEQIPEGMMERIEERLAEHLSSRRKRRKRRKTGYAVMSAALALVLLISVGTSVVTGLGINFGQNTRIKLDGGTLKIDKLYLSSGGTYMDYNFIPQKNSDIIKVEPLLWLEADGRRYDMNPDSSTGQALGGRMICKYPLSQAEIESAELELQAVNQTVKYEKTIKISGQKAPFYFDIKGTQAEVRTETENGKTIIKIEVKDIHREFVDFNVVLTVKDNKSGSMLAFSKKTDISKESLLSESTTAAVQKDVTYPAIEKAYEFVGVFDEIFLEIQSLDYLVEVQEKINAKGQ